MGGGGRRWAEVGGGGRRWAEEGGEGGEEEGTYRDNDSNQIIKVDTTT